MELPEHLSERCRWLSDQRAPVGEGPVALLLALDPGAARFPLEIATRTIAGVAIPVLPFAPGDAAQALRAEHALLEHGLPLPKPGESA